MRISSVFPISLNKNQTKQPIRFTSETVYQDHKIIEKDILSLSGAKNLSNNPATPTQEILGVNINRTNEKTIELTSRYGNKTGTITYNPNVKQPIINVQAGSFQPVIELKDEDLGLTILMTRGSSISGSDLNINYKELAKPNISFGTNQLIVTTGYKADRTKAIVNNYIQNNKSQEVQKSRFADMLKQDYTIVGLAGGLGSRLKPISDLEDDNKPSTKLPGSKKSLFEVSVLDTASHAGKIDNVKFIEDNPDNLLGTAGPIIQGLKDGTIPLDKPLVLLTSDTFNNIDLAQALYAFENDEDCGIAMIVTELNKENILDKAPIKIGNLEYKTEHYYDNDHHGYCLPSTHAENPSALVLEFSKKVTEQNYKYVIDKYSNIIHLKHHYHDGPDNGIKYSQKTSLHSSSNIIILNPKILEILKNFGDKNNEADFVEFLGLMFNILNKPEESLKDKYPNGLKSANLSIEDLIYNTEGKPSPINNTAGDALKLKAIAIPTNFGESFIAQDIGTIEDYIQTVKRMVCPYNACNIDNDLYTSINNHIDNNGVIYMNTEAKSKLEQFKQKYGISSISGNVIAHSFNTKQPEVIAPKPKEATQTLNGKSSERNPFNLTYNPRDNDMKVYWIVETPKPISNPSGEMIKQNGLMPFIKWYLSPNGYYGAYERFVKDLYKNVKDMEILIKFTPNWAPWKLEEKFWMLQNPSLKNLPEETRTKLFNQELETKREIPFTIGKLPSIFPNEDVFLELVKTLKSQEILDQSLYIGGNSYKAKRLKGGELNDKFIYLIERNGEKFILKFDRINVEDSDTVNGRKLSLLEKRSIRKNKYLAADSIYSNACIGKYLIYQGCKIVPNMFYYHHGANAAVYEYIEDKDGDLFQNDVIDTEYDNLLETNQMHKELNKLGIFVNDTACKNTLTDKNGVKKIIDLGHASFFIPFKLNLKHYNIEFSNSNGPDIGAIYASLMTTLTEGAQQNVNNCK